MLKTRIITALVLATIFLPAMFIGTPEVWGLLSLIGVSVGIYEWCKLLQPKGSKISAASPVAALGAGAGMAWMLLVHAFPGQTLTGFLRVLCAAVLVFWLLFGTLALYKRKPMPGGPIIALLTCFACWLALLELRRIAPLALFSSLALVVFADIAAYFFGKAFGKHKLAPQISPGKSWEGAIGGASTVVILALIGAAAPGMQDTIFAKVVGAWSGMIAALFFLAVIALSIMGDLHESLLKRTAGVKDSGTILPGHGGVFDRIDALIPAMPAAYLLWSMST
jgi:phosphatidate cytidylyltransferase